MALTGLPDQPLGPPDGLVEGIDAAGPLLPRPGRAGAARRARRVDGAVAPRRHELWRELPPAPVAPTGSWPCRCRAPRTWRPCRPGSSSTTCRPRPRPCGPPSRRTCATRDPLELVASAPNCSACRWPGSARRPESPAVARAPLGDARPRPTPTGLVVIDLSALWAGPLCGDLLARAGATVVKVESTQRPDGARRGPAAFFDLLNGRKRSVALDLQQRTTASGSCGRWSDGPTSSSRRAGPAPWPSSGVDARDAGRVPADPRSGSPSPATGARRRGQPGRVRRRRGGGRRAGGLARTATPLFCADAVADPLTGLTAADACLEALAAGGRWLLDVSMAAVSAASPARPCRCRPILPSHRPGRDPRRARRRRSAPTRRRSWPSSDCGCEPTVGVWLNQRPKVRHASVRAPAW